MHFAARPSPLRSRRSESASGRCSSCAMGSSTRSPKTLEEIGKRLGLTRERVRQIELDSLRRLANLREMQMISS